MRPTALPRGRDARRRARRSVVALILLGLPWELWLAPTGNGTLAIKVVPLLLPLAGLPQPRSTRSAG